MRDWPDAADYVPKPVNMDELIDTVKVGRRTACNVTRPKAAD